MQEQYEIPRIIHFIWAGGPKPISKDGREVIAQWAKSNPGNQTDEKHQGFHIKIWVDTITSNTDLEGLIERYRLLFEKHSIDVISGDALYEYNGDTTPIVICDLHEELRTEHIQYEIEKLQPNYGASSDMLRYLILFQEGGAYFDPDVAPNPDQSLESSGLFGFRSTHAVYLDHKTQAANVSDEELLKFKLNQLGNDTFICTKRNPLMKAFYIKAVNGYTDLKERKALTTRHLDIIHQDVKDLTIMRTGPKCVTQVIQSCKNEFDGQDFQLQVDKDVVSLCRVRDGKKIKEGGLSLTKPLKNTSNWLKVNIDKLKKEPERAYKRALRTIEYELNHYKILDLDAQIRCIATSLDASEFATAKQLFAKLKQSGLLKKPILYMRVGLKYPQTIAVCKALMASSGCMSLFNLPAQYVVPVVDMETGVNLRHSLMQCVAHIGVYGGSLHDVYSKQDDFVLQRMSYQIREGMNYIERLIDNIAEFSAEVGLALCNRLSGDECPEKLTVKDVGKMGVLQVYDQYCRCFEKISESDITVTQDEVALLRERVGEVRDQLVDVIKDQQDKQVDMSSEKEVSRGMGYGKSGKE